MNQDDRYKTTSWVGDEVARQEYARPAGSTDRQSNPTGGERQAPRPTGEEPSRPAGTGAKKKKK